MASVDVYVERHLEEDESDEDEEDNDEGDEETCSCCERIHTLTRITLYCAAGMVIGPAVLQIINLF